MRRDNDKKSADKSTNPAADLNKVATAIREGKNLHVTLSLGILALIAMVASLNIARSFFVPLLIGILDSYSLHPLVEGLNRIYIPRPIGAALVLALMIGAVSWATISLSDNTAAVIEKMPDAARKLRENLSEKRTSTIALLNMQEAENHLEGAAADAGAKPGTRAIATRVREPTAWLHNDALSQTTFVLHLIPYPGPTLVVLGAAMAVFLQFGSVFLALAASGLVILVSGIVGLVFSAWLQSRFARENAAILFISLLFFTWIWGVWGLLLGGPLVAIEKVICDRVKSLKPLSELLER